MAQLVGPHGGDQSPLLDDGDPVTGTLHLVEHVGGHQDSFARGLFLVNELDEGMLHQGIQAAGRLIEDKDGRVVHERADQPDFLFHSLGHPPEPAGGVELEPGDEAFRRRISRSPRSSAIRRMKAVPVMSPERRFPWQIP